ncbi:MAG: hypothetical protein FJ144_22310 [Deltaproteobacteria bacterium]|nr:hypothetical protein [Deltaproteobacteria bacterium]
MSAWGWQVALLVPGPPLTLLYLLLIRAEQAEPSFAPAVVLGLAPLASLAVGLRVRPWRKGLFVLALLELAWSVLTAALVGFAIAARSG